MIFKTRPCSPVFFDLFDQVAANLGYATGLLLVLVSNDPSSSVLDERLAEVERNTDQLTHELYRNIYSTFVTPFDRSDVYRLAGRLDDVMDHLEAAGSLLSGCQPTTSPDLRREFGDLVGVLAEQAKATSCAMTQLRGLADQPEYWVASDRLERTGYQLYRATLVRLLSGEFETMAILKMRAALEELVAACAAFAQVADRVKMIVAKHI